MDVRHRTVRRTGVGEDDKDDTAETEGAQRGSEESDGTRPAKGCRRGPTTKKGRGADEKKAKWRLQGGEGGQPL